MIRRALAALAAVSLLGQLLRGLGIALYFAACLWFFWTFFGPPWSP